MNELVSPRKSDRDLLEDFQQSGDEAAFAELVQRHTGFVYRIALRKTGRVDWSEDIAQQVFITFGQKAINGLQLRGHSLANWLYKTTSYCASHKVRSEGRHRRRNVAYVEEEMVDSGMEESSILPSALDEALQSLRQSDREVVFAHYYEGRTYREIGERFGKGADACRKQCERAVARLSHWLETHHSAVGRVSVVAALSQLGLRDAPASLGRRISELSPPSSEVATQAKSAFLPNISWLVSGALGLALPLVLLWPAVTSRFVWVLSSSGHVEVSSVVPTDRGMSLEVSEHLQKLDLEWLGKELARVDLTLPRKVKLRVMVESLDEIQLQNLAEISGRLSSDHHAATPIFQRWGEINPTGALRFLKFDQMLERFSRGEIQMGAGLPVSLKVKEVLSGWAASDPDGLVQWVLNGGEKHVHYIKFWHPLASFSPRHAILLGDELGGQDGEELQIVGLSTWAVRQPEEALAWMADQFDEEEALLLISDVGKSLSHDLEQGMVLASWLQPRSHDLACEVIASGFRYQFAIEPDRAAERLMTLPSCYAPEEILRSIVVAEERKGRFTRKPLLRRCLVDWHRLDHVGAEQWLLETYSTSMNEFLSSQSP